MIIKRAALYLRIGEETARLLGVRQQDQQCRELANRLGAKVVAVYCDGGTSAKFGRHQARPDYTRMLTDATAGWFDMIIACSSGHLPRRVIEYQEQIELALHHGIEFRYATSTPESRYAARIMALYTNGVER